ncbi:class I SAM-dependent methyltransferase [Azotosporobacter soli]|uniref:class I SAM-dependent methyltransferase n=1 Tax=Azotosporobacter soli TaxID=3055040 RepID=UPI0031FF3163
MEKAFKAWTDVYKQYFATGQGCAWPSETLVRLFRGHYVEKMDKEFDGKKVLDIGFGNGNNLVFLKSLGLDVFGIEVTDEICQVVMQRLANLGDFKLQVGTNRELPFETDYFDYLVSWNVIHYENNAKKMDDAIREYSRVIKPGGRFFISTTGPEMCIKKDAERLDKNLWKIGRDDDFRKGEVFFYFDSPQDIKEHFSTYFSEVQVGRVEDDLFAEKLDFYIITGVKK